MTTKYRNKTALYLRLSDEDKNKLSKEELSESIKNQEIMLRNYALEQGFNVIKVYNDEDWSGSDISRPDFNKMIRECQNGNIDIVLCKTQARFARDMELVEKYVHNLFHEWQVRFITVVDKIDNTKKETKKTSQILSLTDEWYLEDTSLNIRETLKAKRKEGKLTSSFATYGYKKDPENKNHLIIDVFPSLIIKRIYNEYLSGIGLDQIAQNLNKDNILSPYEYKLMQGSKLKLPVLKNYLNYSYIVQSGTYIVDINFTNKEPAILKDLVSLIDLSSIFSKCDIILRKTNKTQIYYSTKENITLDNLNIKDCVSISENETLPKHTKAIISYTKNLDRTHFLNYQLEIKLKENKEHKKLFINIANKAYQQLTNSYFTYNIRKKFKWSSSTIRKILTDEVYTGNMVQFKTTTVSYKNHTLIKNGAEKRIRKENTHEKIIDKNIWDKVQVRLSNRTRSCNQGKIHPLCNKVYCANCNQLFIKTGSNTSSGLGYLCCKDKKTKWSNCDNKMSVKEETLQKIILEKINNMLSRFYDKEIINKLSKEQNSHNFSSDRLPYLEQELENINKHLQLKENYFQNLYLDRVNKILSLKEFEVLLKKYEEEYEKLETEQRIIQNEITSVITKQKNEVTNIFQEHKNFDKLTVELVETFVEKIIVGKYNELTNTRNIKIIWNFII